MFSIFKQQLSFFSPKIKSYVGVVETYPFSPLDLERFFSGKIDKTYANNNETTGEIQASPYFRVTCRIFTDLSEAAKATARRGTINKSAYVFAMCWPPETVIEAAANGKFSKGIIEAINAEDYSIYGASKDPKKQALIEIKANPYYNSDTSCKCQ